MSANQSFWNIVHQTFSKYRSIEVKEKELSSTEFMNLLGMCLHYFNTGINVKEVGRFKERNWKLLKVKPKSLKQLLIEEKEDVMELYRTPRAVEGRTRVSAKRN